MNIGPRVLVDVKTKVLTLTSNPKGYNIDKLLGSLSDGNTVFSFFFVGVDPEAPRVKTRLVSVLDKTILPATRIRFHWAGRNSRGVTQLTGDISEIFDPNFTEHVQLRVAKGFLRRLIDLS